jgi:hypothetical protein
LPNALTRAGERRRVLRCGAVVAAVVCVFVAPWAARNYRALGGFVPLRSNFGLELAVGNRPGATGYTYARGFWDMHPYASAAERARLTAVGELAYMRDMRRRALAWVAANRTRFVRLTGRRALLFWFTPDERWYSLTRRVELPVRAYGLLGFGALAGLLRLLWRRQPAGVLLACALFGIGLPYFVTHVEMRYRTPIVGLSALVNCDLAAAAAGWVWVRCRRRAPADDEATRPFAGCTSDHLHGPGTRSAAA